MCKKSKIRCGGLILLVSVVLALGLVSGARGDVIDSFENGPGAWEIINPPETLAQGTEGVTEGTYSLQRNFTAGWHFIDLDISGFVDVLNANDTLEIDVTTSLTAEQVGWYLEHLIILQGGNAAGSYYLEGPLVSVASSDGTPTTTTVSFNYGPALADGPLTDWAKIRLVNNTGGDGALYYDNLRAVSSAPAPPSSGGTVIGDWEDGMDGWEIVGGAPAGSATEFSTEGVTLGAQSLKLTIPEGDWKDAMMFNINAQGLNQAFQDNRELSIDVTRLVADWTGEPNDGYSELVFIVNAGGDGWSIWDQSSTIGWWKWDQGDQTQTVTFDYSSSLPQIQFDNIWWLELFVISNYDAAYTAGGVYYLDNAQLSGAQVAGTGKSTDTVIGNWEQDMDGWVAGGGAEPLFNDHNGVTLDDYSLDVWHAASDWQELFTLDLMGRGLVEAFAYNQEISVDITRLVADWPTDTAPDWGAFHMAIDIGGANWSLWQEFGYNGNWIPGDGDQTATVVWSYSDYLSQMDFTDITWAGLIFISNYDPAYTGGVLFYLDNMKLTGGGGALDPQPADGATDVPIDTTLSWTAGAFATSHHLYFGTDLIKVSDADMDSDPNVVFAELDVANFDPNGLEFKTQYFWRVDEVNEANPDSPWKSPVWSFTAADFLIIDDFESYNDIDPPDPESHTIFDAWADGYGIPTNGALVGHDNPPYAEQVTIRNGIQSMPLKYDNIGEALQSETQRVWAEPQDWTGNPLKLYTYGNTLNTPGELYVIIEDNAGLFAKVVDPNTAIFTTEEWTEWEISLDDVAAAGVNLMAVTKLVIGIADLPGQAEASGILYVDDIRRYPPKVVFIDPDLVVVPKTAVAPVIDGMWDAVWNDVNETRCLITDMSNTDSETPEDSNDLSAIFKAFFDDSNFYIFVEVHDSVIDYEFSDWQGDGVEFYFDGDYSHGDSYDGVNDNQIRITVDDVVLADIDSSVPIDGTVFKVLLTASGYNIEASFPLEALQIYPSEDLPPLVDADGVEIPNSGIALNNIIGFEVQINDNDSAGGRQTLLRWHSDNNDSWDNPSLFGQARLVGSTVGN